MQSGMIHPLPLGEGVRVSGFAQTCDAHPPRLQLLADRDYYESRAPVLLIALFAGFPANGTLFSIADCLDDRRINPFSNKRFLYLVGAAIPQTQVVLSTSPLVTATFDRELHVAVLFQPGSVRFHTRQLVGADVTFIEIKVNGLNVLVEKVRHIHRSISARLWGRRSGCGRDTDCDKGAVGSGPARSHSHGCIRYGRVWMDRLGPSSPNASDFRLDTDTGCILCFPLKRCGLPSVNGVRGCPQSDRWSGVRRRRLDGPNRRSRSNPLLAADETRQGLQR